MADIKIPGSSDDIGNLDPAAISNPEQPEAAPAAERTDPAEPGSALGPDAPVDVEPSDALAQLAEAALRGQLTGEQVLDRLVEQAVADVDAALSPGQRAELSAVLRRALNDDPTLKALRKDLTPVGQDS